MKVIYQNRLMNINYKDSPFHGAVICKCCWNCSTVRSHGPFRGIIPNNIHWKIEIVNNNRMMNDEARVHITVKVCSLLFVICQDCIHSSGPENGGNRSFTNNSTPCQCRFFTIGCGGAVPGASGVDFMIATSADTCFTSSSVAPPPLYLIFFSAGLYPLACLFL